MHCVSTHMMYPGHTQCDNNEVIDSYQQCQHTNDTRLPHIWDGNNVSASLQHTMAIHLIWQQYSLSKHSASASLWHTMATHTMWQQWSHVHCGSTLMTYHGHTYNVTTVKSYSLCQHLYDMLWPHIQCDNSEVIFTASILKAQGATHLNTLFTEHYLLMHRNEWNLAKTNSCAHFIVTGEYSSLCYDLMWPHRQCDNNEVRLKYTVCYHLYDIYKSHTAHMPQL